MNATPRPWTARGTTIWADASHPPMGHEIIANTRTARGDKHDMDNAAHIVRAVNSFDAMREALEAVDRWDTVSLIDEEWPEIMEQVRAALALAKGEQ